MLNRKFLNTMLSVLMVAAMLLGLTGQAANAQQPQPSSSDTSTFHQFKGKVRQADHAAAAERYKALTQHVAGAVCSTPLIGTTPDYFGCYPNYATTQLPQLDVNGNVVPGTGIRKFVDSLSGITPAGANNLGNYVSIAKPDTTTYPGSDYYEIAVVEYFHKFSSDLAPTRLRGYVQLETNVVKGSHVALSYLTGGPLTGSALAGTAILYNGQPVYAVDNPQYLGPTVVAQKDRPVRVKFINLLPYGTANAQGIRPGDLFIPTDLTIMGAGVGPNGGGEMYTQNRETLHLHGGRTPWISDGTPHQWVTPAGETTSYPQGVSTYNVPDMPDPGPGAMTFFYSNQQSARLMFYHDHAYGITRLNVYAGTAAGYLLQDPTEAALVAAGTIPADIIPLVIQDKTFVPDAAQLAYQDPTWNSALYGGQGSLWFPHVYMPNQNPADMAGANAMGRWDYGPWFWPIFVTTNGAIANPYAGLPGEPSVIPGTPLPSSTPESFMDTPVVNGVAYPYLNVDPRPYRFRILNAANDRYWNLSWFQAASSAQMWSTYGVAGPTDPNAVLLDGMAGEVPMVPAIKDSVPNWPATWPTDNRDGGVPDPNYAGPSWVSIGTEGGFLPSPVVIPPQPVDYVYDRRNIVVLNVSSHGLFLGPAERADVIVDFAKFAGKTLILYNDSPAPVPAPDPRIDYYTGDPDHSWATGDGTGGAPSTLAGYGPNTRTIMQVRVAPIAAASSGIDHIIVNNGGASYTNPTVMITNTTPGGSGAAAQALGSVDHIVVTNPGTGYTTAPVVTLSGGGIITQATAVATIKLGRLTGIRILTPGVNYLTAPIVTLTGGGCTTNCGTAVATLRITGVAVLVPGSGYTTPPDVYIDDTVGGYGATGVAYLTPGAASFNQAPLDAAFTTSAAGLGVFAKSQEPILIPDARYNSVYNSTFPADQFARIQYTSTTFTNINGVPLTIAMKPKAIQELFDPDYGRMNSILGVEVPNTTNINQTTIPFFYIDPLTEDITDSVTPLAPAAADGTQVWKITHNGVDTHAIHFHLYDVQILNRVGWDGAIRPAEPFEMGWKETVRMNPLEDIIVALRPVAPKLPFGLPISKRAMDVTSPLGSTMNFTGVDPNGNPVTVINQIVSFGWEYVWHCHLLGHEENDMMRPVKFNVAVTLPGAPVLTNLTGYLSTTTNPSQFLQWTDATPKAAPTTLGNPSNEIGFMVQRCRGNTCTNYVTIATVGANTTSYLDSTIGSSYTGTTVAYRYRIVAFNAAGASLPSNIMGNNAIVGVKPIQPENFAASILQPSGVNPVRASLSWSAVTMTGKTMKYQLTRTPAFTTATCNGAGGFAAGVCNLTSGTTAYVDATVQVGKKYVYSLVAYNVTDSIASSPSALTVVPSLAPIAPTNLTSPAGTTTRNSITLNWVNNQVNPAVGGFEVYRSLNGATNWTLIGTIQGPITTFTVTGLTPNTAYWFRVRAFSTGTPAVFSGYTPALPGLRVITLP